MSIANVWSKVSPARSDFRSAARAALDGEQAAAYRGRRTLRSLRRGALPRSRAVGH